MKKKLPSTPVFLNTIFQTMNARLALPSTRIAAITPRVGQVRPEPGYDDCFPLRNFFVSWPSPGPGYDHSYPAGSGNNIVMDPDWQLAS